MNEQTYQRQEQGQQGFSINMTYVGNAGPSNVLPQVVDPEKAKTETLLKTVRGILKKLTQETSDESLIQIQQLPIDTQERLAGVVKLFYDKAVDETHFSPLCARMCRAMSIKLVPSSENPKELVSFRKLLLIHCQKVFERDITSLADMEEKREQLEAEDNEENRKKLEASLSEMKAKTRRVELGNIRFTGELFKIRMLTPRIMHTCVTRLLSAADEGSIELLCLLMSTIGQDLEQTLYDSSEMTAYFSELTEMSQDTVKYPNRIRFMIQDLLDLRNNDWKPTRPIKGGGDNKFRRAESSRRWQQIWREPPEEGMNISHAPLDVARLSTSTSPEPAPFGIQASVGIGAVQSVDSAKLAVSSDLRSGGGCQRQETDIGDPGPQRSSDEHQYQGREMPQQREERQIIGQAVSTDSSASHIVFKGPSSMNEEDLEQKTKNIIDEYQSNWDLKVAVLNVSEQFHPRTIAGFVDQAAFYKLEGKDIERRLAGELFQELVKKKLLSKSAFVEGLKPLLGAVEYYIVGIPNLVEYIAHITAPVFIDSTLPLSTVEELAQPLVGTTFGAPLVIAIFIEIAEQTTSSELLSLWSSSRPQLDKFPSQGIRVEEWLKDQGFAYLADVNTSSQSSDSSSSVISPELKRKLNHVLRDFDGKEKKREAIRLVETYLTVEQRTSPSVVRALVTIVVESTLNGEGINTKVDKDNLSAKVDILKRYVNCSNLELETLIAVQGLWRARGSPQKMLEVIFEVLYAETVVFEDAFRTWKDIFDSSDGNVAAVLDGTDEEDVN